MPFDPDAYLAKSGFDPDAYLGQARPQPAIAQPTPAQPEKSLPRQALDAYNNVGMGMLRGAGSIGATFLSPLDAAARKMGVQNDLIGLDRRAGMDAALTDAGADTNSLAFQGGKVGAEIAGTAGAPGVLAKGAQALRAAPSIVNALRAGGTAGNLPTRIASGAASGALSAGLVNPEDADTGALLGGGMPVAVAALRGARHLTGQAVGASTGVGGEALSQAYSAGKQGGKAGESFRENIRGQSNMEDVLTSAKQNLDVMGQQKQAAYRSNMQAVKNDKTMLKFDDIDNAIKDALSVATYKGQVKNPEAAAAIEKISDQVQQWRQLTPQEFHTPEGMDALKQSISGVLESLPFEQRTARLAAGKIYDSIKKTIQNQAPDYAKAMKDYSEASDLIREIEKSLVGGNKSTAESSMRKLQSLMRNNVNTSYGYRTDLAKELENQGGQQIMPALAGQALSEWTPRGIQRAAVGPTSFLAYGAGGVPLAAANAALASPRLMGEASHLAGRASGAIPQYIIDALRQGSQTAAPVMAAQ